MGKSQIGWKSNDEVKMQKVKMAKSQNCRKSKAKSQQCKKSKWHIVKGQKVKCKKSKMIKVKEQEVKVDKSQNGKSQEKGWNKSKLKLQIVRSFLRLKC